MRKRTLIRSITLALTLGSIGAATALAEPSSRERRGPPPEAVTACEALAEESSCSFVGRRSETITGVCLRPPRDDSSTLACVPNDHQRRPRSDGRTDEPS